MINENQFIQWIFKHDDETLFIIFCMRVAMCNQPPRVKDLIINIGLKIIQNQLQEKVKKWQSEKKLNAISQDFYHTVDKTIRKTMSYQYASNAITNLMKELIEIHIKDDNPQGIFYYLQKISNSVRSLLPDQKAKEKFKQFWAPIEGHDCNFIPEYYRNKINQSQPMRLWTKILNLCILLAILLVLTQEISFSYGLWIVNGAVIINYLSRSAWRISALLQHKASLSEEASQESHGILLDLIGLRRVPRFVQANQSKNQKKSEEMDFRPNWHQETTTALNSIRSVSNENHQSRLRKPKNSESPESSPAIPRQLVEAAESMSIKWRELSPPAVFDPVHPERSNAYPLRSSRFTYAPLFGRLHPALIDSMPKSEFDHFHKIVERGRIIPSKSRGLQGIKPTFLEYRTVFGQTALSDYKLKIPRHNPQVFGHEVAVTRLHDKNYTLIEFDGYDPNAHETAYRKVRN